MPQKNVKKPDPQPNHGNDNNHGHGKNPIHETDCGRNHSLLVLINDSN